MKILVGICGFGNGHSARQASLIPALLASGHQLALMGFLNSEKYFKAYFPELPLYPIKVPIIHVSSQSGIDFEKTAQEHFNQYDDGQEINFSAMQMAYDHFKGKPDLVIADYELVCAQYAYALDVPLITVDQQSKFAGFEFPEINGFHRREEKSRLAMFFPRAEARFACSFFQIPWEPDDSFPVNLIPPILRDELRLISDGQRRATGEVVVYFSPHGYLKQFAAEVYDVFTQFPDKKFRVFSRKPEADFANISFHTFEPTRFFEALRGAESVITTAGHNLLSELAYLCKPVYTLPFPTFDQQCCAYMIQQNGLGIAAEEIRYDDLKLFFEQLPEFQHNLDQGIGLTTGFHGIDVLMNALNTQFGV